MPLKSISPLAASELMTQGGTLVDIRTADEHARERIAQAHHVHLDRLKNEGLQINDDVSNVIIFHCRSGNRTQLNASVLEACTNREAYILEGGLDAWKKAGLPVVTDTSHPLELQRQVQIAAGTLIMLGAVLGATVSPWFHTLSAFVGAGLAFAGISGFCGLARVLLRMPWNHIHPPEKHRD